MGKEFLKKTSDLLQEKHKRKQWQKVVISLSLVVAMITTGLLIHPAITMERKTICGQEEHTHSKDCYIKKLVCGKEETTASEGAEGEAVEEHKHTDACYEEVLVCNKEEHKHTDACYPKETKAKEETTEAKAEDKTETESKDTKSEATDKKESTEQKADDKKEEAKSSSEQAAEATTEAAADTTEETAKARTLTHKGEDYNITVDCPKEAEIPAAAKLKVREIKPEKDKEEYKSYFEKAEKALNKNADKDISFARFFDISFVVDDKEIEPKAKVEVKITYDKKVEVSDKGEVKSVHFGDDKTEVLDVKTNEAGGKMDEIKFNAKSFSVYAVVGTETLTGDVLTADGKTYTVTVSYGADAGIPEGAELEVKEIAENSKEYQNYSKQALEAMTSDQDVTIAAARFFDVTILVNGEKYEPKAPVNVKITYNDPLNIEMGDEIKQVHFADKGTEVLDVEVDKDNSGQITDVSFQQSSFSVTGTVVAATNNGWPTSTGYYALIIKANNNSKSKYYAVKKDGTLIEVNYDVDTKKVSFPTLSTDELVEYEWEYNKSDNSRYLNSGSNYINPYFTMKGYSNGDSKRSLTISNGSLYCTKSKTKYYLAFHPDTLKIYGTTNESNADKIIEIIFANSFSADSTAGGGTPGGDGGNVDLGAPATSKTLDSNDDGTYNLSLSVKGKSEAQNSKSKADVLVVFDTSGSMVTGRMSTAKTAMRNLAQLLLANNTESESDAVRMAMITFSTKVNTTYNWTTDTTVFAGTKNSKGEWSGGYIGQIGTKGNGGTNWEAALQQANTMKSSMRSEASKYVIFVSDGNPTFHISDGGFRDENTYYGENIYGTGQETKTSLGISGEQNVLNCYNVAKDDARAIVTNGMNFYTVGVFGNPDRMSNLTAYAYSGNDIGTYPAGHYQVATDSTSLNKAFESIINEIQKNFSYSDVTIKDGITDLTSTVAIMGTAGEFVYSITDADGNSIAVPEELKTAYYDTEEQTVFWPLGSEYKLQNGYTYKVSFKVWPKQQAYDIIAALKNGDIAFGDSAATVNDASVDWSQFVDNGNGNYSLKTNTSASASYRQITTTNGTDGDPSKLKESPIIAQPSMPLTTGLVTIEKEWQDTSYEQYRPDSVSFKVLCDDIEYKTVNLKKANDWKASIYIAPGLKVDNDILETGHDYSVEEIETTESYEFTSSGSIHPMLINSATNISYGEGKSAVLTGTNTYHPSSFNVRIFKTDIGTKSPLEGAEFKLCSDLDGNTIAKDADGNDVSIQYQTGGIYLIGNLSEGTYYLFETKAPDGYYLLEEPIKITVSQNGVRYDQPGNSNSQDTGAVKSESENGVIFTINVTNTSGQELPNTGGSGTLPYTLGGLMIMTAAALMYGFMMRRRGRRLN